MQSSFSIPENFICTLGNFGIISLDGDDAASYLQGKVTNDIDALDTNRAQLGCHCDFKGKMWNIFYAYRNSAGIHMLSHKEGIPESLSELKKYGVFSKVTFSAPDTQYQIVGLRGKAAEDVLLKHFDALPQEHLAQENVGQATLIKLMSAEPRFMLIASPAMCENIVDQLKEYQAPESLWELLDIKAGVANIQAATVGEYIPQMLNMQSVGAISFDKGCYMGQEVVARTKYLGKNKRAAFILQADKAYTVSAGDVLEIQIGENWRRGGAVIRASIYEQSSWLLAVLPNDTIPNTVLRSKNMPEQYFTVRALPYNID